MRARDPAARGALLRQHGIERRRDGAAEPPRARRAHTARGDVEPHRVLLDRERQRVSFTARSSGSSGTAMPSHAASDARA
jgi:hypothetical protein